MANSELQQTWASLGSAHAAELCYVRRTRMNEEFPPRQGSIVWDNQGHYRGLTWEDFCREVRATAGGLGVAARDFVELLEYRPSPYRDKTWTLREAATELLADAVTDEDLRFLAKVCVVLVQMDRYLEACWLLVRLRTSTGTLDAERVARVLNHLHNQGGSQLRLVLLGLGGFVESYDPLVKTMDVVAATGLLGREVLAMMRAPRIFICYATEDQDKVQRLHDSLIAAGFSPWLDRERLVAGDEWKPEIESAIDDADFAVPCLSRSSLRKIGFFQVELRRLLNRQEHHPPRMAFVLPVRLEPCEVPSDFRRYQWLDLFPQFEEGLEQLTAAVRSQWARRNDV
jgi:hypothetical protein